MLVSIFSPGRHPWCSRRGRGGVAGAHRRVSPGHRQAAGPGRRPSPLWRGRASGHRRGRGAAWWCL